MEKRLPDRLGLLLVEPLERHPDLEAIAEPQRNDLPPVWIEEIVGIEVDELTDQPAKGGVGKGVDRCGNRAKERRQLMRLEGEPGDDAEAAATAAFEPPKQVRIGAGIGDADLAVGGDDLGFQQPRRSGAEIFREAAKATRLNQPGDPDRAAAAALHIATALGRHLVVGMHPDCARPDRDGGLRRLPCRAPLRGEIVVQSDGVHAPGPDQQRIRRIRSAEIAVAAAFDDQPQVIIAGEIDCSKDVTGRLSRHRIDTGLRRPSIDPARGLRQGDVVADVVGIFQLFEEIAA